MKPIKIFANAIFACLTMTLLYILNLFFYKVDYSEGDYYILTVLFFIIFNQISSGEEKQDE